jgi:hypothetical protein
MPGDCFCSARYCHIAARIEARGTFPTIDIGGGRQGHAPVPVQVGNDQILDVIGSGAFAMVFRACHLDDEESFYPVIELAPHRHLRLFLEGRCASVVSSVYQAFVDVRRMTGTVDVSDV